MDTKSKQIGKYIRRNDCRFCQGENLAQIMDFGNMPLAGGFLGEKDLTNEKLYPLDLSFCKDCHLVQVSNVVPAEVLFHDNYFFYSSAIGTLVEHFKKMAEELNERFLKNTEHPKAIELGCNDGVLLKPLAALGVDALGVDPATNVVNSITSKDFRVINDYFSEKLAEKIETELGRFDLFLTSYSFAHIDDMVDILKGVKKVLKDDGVLVFEVYYLGTLVEEMQYDMIYHEHMSYYSLSALKYFLKRFDMEIFDVKYTPGVRSGAVRFYARNIGGRSEPISQAVRDMEAYEEKMGFHKVDTFDCYAGNVGKTREQLMTLLDQLKEKGKTVIGYGASGRGTMIMNYCGIDRKYVDYVIDDAPAKQGFFTPGTHVPIKSWDKAMAGDMPDYVILFAWAFTDEVLKKRKDYLESGGKFIIPLPEVRVVSKEDINF